MVRGLVSAFSLLSILSSASALTVINHSFEDITGENHVNGEFTFGSFVGWDAYENLNEEAPDFNGGAGNTYYVGTLTPQDDTDTPDPDDFVNFPGGAADGIRVAIAFNYDSSRDTGEYGIEQLNTGNIFAANMTYTLTVDIGNIATGRAQNGTTFPLDGFPGFRIALMANGVEIATQTESSPANIADGEFGTATVNFVTGNSGGVIGQTIGIRLVNLNDSNMGLDVPEGNDMEVDFDNVRLDATAVPEPSAFAALAGLLMLGYTLRRRVKASGQ